MIVGIVGLVLDMGPSSNIATLSQAQSSGQQTLNLKTISLQCLLMGPKLSILAEPYV